MLFLDFVWTTITYCVRLYVVQYFRNPTNKNYGKIIFHKKTFIFSKKSKNCQKLQKMGEIWSFVRQLLFSVEWRVFMRFQRLYPQNLSTFFIQNFIFEILSFLVFLKLYCSSLFFLLKLLTSNSEEITKNDKTCYIFKTLIKI